MTAPLLSVRGLSKSFPGVRALDAVSLDVHSGEIVALVGQNGCGKSSLVKVLTGIHDADPGSRVEVRLGDDVLEGAAASRGIHVIHQDLGLIEGLNTIENLDLGRRHRGGGLLPAHSRQEERRARTLLERFGARFDVRRPVRELSSAERSLVAIARALDGWERPEQVLILDEPTAALHGEEVDRLMAAVRHVAAEGAGVVYISHRLDEVLDLAERVVALRDGRVVADVPSKGVDRPALVRMIAGRSLADRAGTAGTPAGPEVLRVKALRGATVNGLDLSLRRGEVVGISGILGSGREHLASLLFGSVARAGGTVTVEGEPLRGGSPRTAIARGLAHVPAGRRTEGAVMGMRARENLTLPRLRPLTRRFGRLDGAAERAEAEDWVARVKLSPAEPERPLELFSGGNQQKVVLAKWLRNLPSVLLLDEPTQGVDVGATDAIYELIAGAAAGGAAVLVSSSDTRELAVLCHRVLVLQGGRITAELAGMALTEAALVEEGLADRGPDADRLGDERKVLHV